MDGKDFEMFLETLLQKQGYRVQRTQYRGDYGADLILENELNQCRVAALFLFGSVARGEAHAASDIDLLVEFEANQPVSLFHFLQLQFFLEERLGHSVDLATPDALRPSMRAQIMKERVHTA